MVVLKNITDATPVEDGQTCTLCGWSNIRQLRNAVLVHKDADPYKSGVVISICEVCESKIEM